MHNKCSQKGEGPQEVIPQIGLATSIECTFEILAPVIDRCMRLDDGKQSAGKTHIISKASSKFSLARVLYACVRSAADRLSANGAWRSGTSGNDK